MNEEEFRNSLFDLWYEKPSSGERTAVFANEISLALEAQRRFGSRLPKNFRKLVRDFLESQDVYVSFIKPIKHGSSRIIISEPGIFRKKSKMKLESFF